MEVQVLSWAPRDRLQIRNYRLEVFNFVVHWLQRLARRGISLRHSGHFLVVGSLAFLVRAIKMFIGLTTKKNIALATRMKEMRVLRKWP